MALLEPVTLAEGQSITGMGQHGAGSQEIPMNSVDVQEGARGTAIGYVYPASRREAGADWPESVCRLWRSLVGSPARAVGDAGRRERRKTGLREDMALLEKPMVCSAQQVSHCRPQ